MRDFYQFNGVSGYWMNVKLAFFQLMSTCDNLSSNLNNSHWFSYLDNIDHVFIHYLLYVKLIWETV